MRSETAVKSLYGPPCRFRTATVSLYGTGRVTVDYRIVQAIYALNRCLAKHNYRTIYIQTGAYVCRRRKLPSGAFASDYSTHAYGVALDLNWQQNGFGRNASFNIPRACVNDIEAIRTNNGAQVWAWGGHWSVPDYMHFYVCASPAELLNGIRTTAPPPPDEEFRMDADATKAFAALNRRLDTFEEDRLEPTTRRVRELVERIEELEKDRFEPSTRRVREIHEHLNL